MAIHANSTPAPLSPLFTDPLVRRAFERVERDDGSAGVVVDRPRPRLSGGSAEGLLRRSRTAHQPAQIRLHSNYPNMVGVVDEAALLRHAIEIGRDLIAVKAKLGHGNFLPWIEAEFGMSDQTARKFMQSTEALGDKIKLGLDLPPSVLYALAAPSTPDEIREHVVERAAIETAIDRLITILDGLDAGTEDMEPWLGGYYGLGDDRELEDEHGTDLDGGEADPSDYQPWNGSVVARFVVAS